MQDAHDIATILNAGKSGSVYVADCPACGYPRAFSIRENNGVALFKCHVGCSQPAVLNALRQYGATRTARLAAPSAIAKCRRRKIVRDSERASMARRLWSMGKVADGTLAETYLKSRGISGPIPPSIRFVADLPHLPSGLRFPCMIAAIARWPEASIVGVHRTFLRHDGSAKTDAMPARMSLGTVQGAAIRLAPASEQLGVAEGIETAFSAMLATGVPCWSALSAGGIESLILPALPVAREVIIFADNDRRGVSAAQRASERWMAEGRQPRIVVPPLPGMDFNDLLCAAECR